MAHFVKLNENNQIVDSVVVNNYVLVDGEGKEIEQNGINFLKSMFGENTKWVQTSYNSNFRKQYAGVGFTYDEQNDVFIAPKPYASWLLDENFDWQAPIEKPDHTESQQCVWNEELLEWQIIDLS